MDKLVELMQEHKIKDSKVEHLEEKCETCKRDLKLVTTIFEDGSTKENRTGCICEQTKHINDKQREINAKVFDRASMMHGDYKNKSFDDYAAETDGQKKAVVSSKKYVEHFDQRLKDGHNILLQGMYGTGKTHIAAAIRNAVSAKQYKALFISAPDYIERLKQEFSDKNKRHPIYKMAQDADLLVIDDIGANRMTDFAISELFRLVDARRGKCTIYTTNLTNADLTASPDLHRIFSRMMEKTKILIVDGNDYRMKGLI